MSPSPLALSVFSCYAQEDADLQEQFEKHLATLKQQEWIHTWSDRDISAGAERQHVIDHHLHTDDLLLLFVSADFINSEDGDGIQMQEVLRRHRAGEAIVIPILLRPVEWKQAPFGALQALPRDGRPVTTWGDRDEAFRQIAQEIEGVVKSLRRPVVMVPCLPDRLFSKRLARDLTSHGIPIFEAETTQEPAILKKHIRKASMVVVITSPGTEPTHTLKEVEDISKTYDCPLIGIWVASEVRDEGVDASLLSHQYEWIVVDPGQEQSGLQELRAAVQRKRFHGLGLFIGSSQEEPVISQEPRNPYKGLDAFTAADAGDFFGRTALVEALLTTVKTTLSLEKKGQQPARLLALVGASGSGKSSLVLAGLLPALQADRIFESNTWVYLDPIIPGAHPLQELAHILLEYFPEKRLEMIDGDMHYASLSGLHSYARTIAKQRESKHVVLVVDQFEEVFTLTESEQERQQFLDLLVTACTKPNGPLIIVLTLRGDFYDRLMQYPALYTLVADHLTPMLPMTLPDLRAVIIQPAKLPDVQLTFEGNLVGDLLFDVQGQIGVLPLLQFTLEQLFERREGHLLTEYAYQEIGGIRGALARHAEETYLALPSQRHRQLTHTLFLRLLDPGTTEQETIRRRTALTEFVFADGEQTRLMQETRDTFVKARLLTTTANERTGTTTVEVSHEALIREWPRLMDWLREARDDIHLQQSISRDATMWEQNKHSGDRLYQGTELKEAQAWAKRNTVSRQEQAFLKASVVRRLRSLLTVIAVILLVVTSSGIATWIVLSQPKPDYVTTANDDGTGSLRWAIKNAPSGNTITFDPALKGQTIILKIVNIHITQQNLTIQSPVTGHITVRVMGVSILVDKPARVTISGITFWGSKTKEQSSLIQNAGVLTLERCSISDNTAFNYGSYGGGISNDGTLTLINSPVSGNTISSTLNISGGSGGSGGISNSGALTLINSPVSGNTASGDGGSGGISNSGVLTLINSPVSDNTASRYGGDGGISNSGTLILTNSPVSGNTAPGDRSSGGISNDGTLTLTNSPVSGNIAYDNGGGIYNSGALMLINSPVSDNTTSGSGGGIYNGGTLTLTNSLVSDNTASGSGGGIYNSGNSDFIAHTTLVFCTIVNNRTTDRHGFDIYNGDPVSSHIYLKASIVGGNGTQDTPIKGGTITSGGYNVIQNLLSLHFVDKPQSTDRSINDLRNVFRPFPISQNKDDPTQAYQLIPNINDPAYNAVPRDVCTDAKDHRVLTDQRGMPRPGKNKSSCDSGAYESQASP